MNKKRQDTTAHGGTRQDTIRQDVGQGRRHHMKDNREDTVRQNTKSQYLVHRKKGNDMQQ